MAGQTQNVSKFRTIRPISQVNIQYIHQDRCTMCRLVKVGDNAKHLPLQLSKALENH
ncbi:uncharacterized protein METZ01_LOCUS6775 [marine metagenome]|uniref:Uncharacterized protein n=1 Tax=marine metagenome TaxID=408172 RepID=A0A381NH90_9ZZZZ